MKTKILFILDPISELTLYKDTSFAFMLEAQIRDIELYYTLQSQLFYQDNIASCLATKIKTSNKPIETINIISKSEEMALTEFTIIMMRINPPFDINYIYTSRGHKLHGSIKVLEISG